MANGHHRSFNDSRFAELSKSKTRNYIRKNNKEKAPLTPWWSNVYGQQFFDDIERNDWRKDRWKIQKNLSSCFWFFQRSILVYLSQREVKISNMQKIYQNKYTWTARFHFSNISGLLRYWSESDDYIPMNWLSSSSPISSRTWSILVPWKFTNPPLTKIWVINIDGYIAVL